MTENLTEYIHDEFVAVRPGEPYRLLPFGALVKNGKRRMIDAELASHFRLPHFRAPIKLGSHDETTPAGGHIVGLEVRQDGLYAVPELNDKGAQALEAGAYRYHSPEIIWAGGLEDPRTGELIPAPLIVGDALLHTPHLGEAAALYEIEPKGINMSETETMSMTPGLWARFTAWLDRNAPETGVALPDPEAYAALEVEKLNLEAEKARVEAELAALRADQAHAARVEHYGAQLRETTAEPNGEMLASMTDEQAAWVVQQLRALSAQIAANDALTTTIGTSAEAPPAKTLDQRISEYAAANKISYARAVELLRAENPENLKE